MSPFGLKVPEITYAPVEGRASFVDGLFERTTRDDAGSKLKMSGGTKALEVCTEMNVGVLLEALILEITPEGRTESKEPLISLGFVAKAPAMLPRVTHRQFTQRWSPQLGGKGPGAATTIQVKVLLERKCECEGAKAPLSLLPLSCSVENKRRFGGHPNPALPGINRVDIEDMALGIHRTRLAYLGFVSVLLDCLDAPASRPARHLTKDGLAGKACRAQHQCEDEEPTQMTVHGNYLTSAEANCLTSSAPLVSLKR